MLGRVLRAEYSFPTNRQLRWVFGLQRALLRWCYATRGPHARALLHRPAPSRVLRLPHVREPQWWPNWPALPTVME